MLANYDLSILSIFKNEESFLPEWIDHYFNRNIDHLYLLNDNSSDNSVDIIQQHPNKKNITLLHTAPEDWSYTKEWRQQYLYNKYYKYCLLETKWLGVFDLDEFCYCPYNKNLKEIVLSYNLSDIHELIIDWYWFGSNNFDDQPQSIIKSFTKRSSKLSKIVVKEKNIDNISYHSDWCCKSFARTKYISEIRHHYNLFYYLNNNQYRTNGKNVSFNLNLSSTNEMFINHYIGSKNYYFNNKVSRGSCNNNIELLNNKAKIYDFINLNEIEDLRLKDQL